MNPRSSWPERWKRPGWDSFYTVLGGRLSDDPVALLSQSYRPDAERATSQVFVVASHAVPGEVPEFTKHWATVVRKVLLVP